MIPVWKLDWELLGMQWNSMFYVDTCLPFGLRSAPFLFNEFADTLEWILKNNYNLKWVLHYLDDYVLAGPPGLASCEDDLRCFLQVCENLGLQLPLRR